MQMTKFDTMVSKVRESSLSCASLEGAEYDNCFTSSVANDILKLEEKKNEITKYRDLISERLRNYTCADEKMETSEAIRSETTNINNKDYNLSVLFETDRAKIWAVPDFISNQECDILERHATPYLARATVAAGDGTNIIMNSRRADQAGYNLHQHDRNDPLVPLQDRIIKMINQIPGYKITPHGQEDFTVIRYNVTDEYFPHCDGSCDGDLANTGGRIATAVLYCKIPQKGGATVFTKADVFVKPIKGWATFFTYKGPDGRMDEGFTEHSGCPVLEGEKWITTFWMRENVTAENPWTVYDPSGVKIEDTAAIAQEISVTGDEEL